MLDAFAAEDAAPVVFAADPREATRIYGALTLAFAADPANRWMYPEPQQYLRYFPAFAKALGGAALAQGTTVASTGYSGVALWLAPGTGPDEQALAALVEESVAHDKRATLLAVFEEMGRRHPEEPHWYLPFIGVEPLWQGKGIGAALLRRGLAQSDAAGLPAYLESTNPRNRPLYERHGFVATGEISVGDCPPIVAMLRRPRPAATD
jgi:GNAT superfamily N-acetyltransferase